MTPLSQDNKDRAAIIIAVGAVFICITMGLRQSFGLLLAPYTAELNIGRDTFAFAIALQNMLWGLASPVFGHLADRRGAVLPTFIGSVFYVGGLVLMAMAGGGGTVLLAQAFVGIGLAGAGFSVILGAVGKAAKPQHRSLALAIVSAAGSFGQFALVPVAQLGFDKFGAQDGVFLLAGIAALMLLCAPLLRTAGDGPAANKSKPGDGWAVTRVAFASRSYVLLFVGFFVCGFQVVFIATHLPAFVSDAGLPVSAAATALALVGLFNIFGTLGCGWAGGKMLKKNLLTWFYALRSFVIIGFLVVPLTEASVIVFGALIGIFWLGTVPLTSGLIAVMFGTRHMSMLYGLVFLSHQAGSFMGAWLGGVLFEATGSYDGVWYIAIILGFVAAVLHFPIREKEDENYARQYA